MVFYGRGKSQRNPGRKGKSSWGNKNNRNKNNPGKNGRKQNNQKKVTVKYIVPAETLKALSSDPWKNVDNLSLKLDKFAPYEWSEQENKEKSDKNDKGKKVTLKVSGNVLKNKVGRDGLKIGESATQAYETYFGLYEAMINNLARDNVFRLKTASRLVVGLGDESVYETSVRLLRNYGVPYIPGTALKGIARAYALEKLADEKLNDLKDIFKTNDFSEIVGKLDKALSNGGKVENEDEGKLEIKATFGKNKLEVSFQDLVEIFGTTEKSGKVVFFDALPVPNGNLNDPLEFDIMNPHYGPYYQRGEAPGDWHDPVPVIFLVVRPGIEFTFAVAPLGNEELARKTRAILEEALKNHGVGAKTSLGYGRFQ